MIRVLMLSALTGIVLAQPGKAPPKPDFVYGLDVKVRGVDEKNFSDKTPKMGFEVFHDSTSGGLLAISETGSLTVIPAAKAGATNKADWIDAAVEFRVRDASVDNFKDAKKFAAELYKDLGSNKLIYVSNQRTLAFADCPATLKTDKAPAWHHALVLKVRGPSENDFKNAKKIGVEAYKDPTSGALIYITDAGAFTTAPAPATAPTADAVKAPQGIYGFPLYARKADEGNFTKDTKMVGIEVYSDPNSGATLYVSETGSIAAVPGVTAAPPTPSKPVWQRSFVLRARKSGETKLENANAYGVEVFEDKNAGTVIFICETGSIAVLKKP